MASQIQEMALEDIMGERFGRYSKYIIQERALPDVRDGLKPVQRRILFAMNADGNTYDHGFRKSAKSVGNVMGNYHPHGDSSIYEAMVRLSQDWKLRAPLIEMHGNNGSMDGDPPAAMRYTEARLAKIAGELLQDIDKATVDMVLNFDDTTEEPTVLPAALPNLLVNGATGISAGYATEIPPHNLREVIKATLHLLKHPDATLDDLMAFVQGPDFPTGGIIQGTAGIRSAYQTGRGKIVVRARTHVDTLRGGKQQIVITELPYEVNKAQLVKRIDEFRVNKKVDGIAEVRDESDRFGLSVVVELKKEANAEGILTFLFKNSDLQINYNFNMVAIADMKPKQLGLIAMLDAYLKHRRNVVIRRTEFDLKKAEARQHIVEGLIKMISILDAVIKTIRGSENKADAKANLVAAYDFTEPQAEAIVSLQLYRLTNTDITALEEEAAALAKAIAEYREILTNPSARDRVIADELRAVAKTYGDDRRSSIEAEIEHLEVDTTVTVAAEQVMVLVSHDGYVKRSSLRSFQAVDEADNGLKDADYPIFQAEMGTLQHLYIVTSAGNIVYRPVHEIADQRWKDAGEHLSQTVGLGADEHLVAAFGFASLDVPGNLVLGATDGFIKQVALADLQPKSNYRSRPMVGMKPKHAGATITNAYFVRPDAARYVFAVTQRGKALLYPLAEVPLKSANTVGTTGIKVKDGDAAVNFVLVPAPTEAEIAAAKAEAVTAVGLPAEHSPLVEGASDDEVAAWNVANQQRARAEADAVAELDQSYLEPASVMIVTHLGAMKRLHLTEMDGVAKRASIGLVVIREVKSRPHRIVGMVTVETGTEVLVRTDTDEVLAMVAKTVDFNDRYSLGSYLIDIEEDGTPVQLRVPGTPADAVLGLTPVAESTAPETDQETEE